MHAASETQTTHLTQGLFRLPAEPLFLFISVVIAFAIRYSYVPVDSVINGDGAYYTILGERIVAGDLRGGISAYWSPLYSVLTGLSSLVFEDRDFAGRFVSIVAGSVLLVPAYLLIRDLFGRPSAVVGSILLVIHPFLIKASGWAMTESTYTLILTSAIWTGWHALSKGGLRIYFFTGLLLGAAFLTKPEAIGYLGLFFVLMFAAKLLGCGQAVSVRKLGASYFILTLAFAIAALPYLLFLRDKTGDWTLSAKVTVNLPAADFEGEFLGLSDDGRLTLKDRIWGDDYETEFIPAKASPTSEPETSMTGFQRVKNDVSILGTKAVALIKRQLRNYFPAILPVPFAIVALFGLFFSPWTRSRSLRDLYLALFVVSTIVGYALSAIELRYLFPIIPILVAWSGNGVVMLSEFLVEIIGKIQPLKWIKPPIIAGGIVSILLILTSPMFARVLATDPITNIPFEEKEAGLWIRDHRGVEQTLVMSANITPAFYAGATHLYLPDEELSTIIEYAERRGVDYLVFCERRKNDLSKILTSPEMQNLPLVYHDQQHPGLAIAVFELRR